MSMLFLGLSLLGLISYNQLSLEMMPEVESPYLIVRITSSTDMNPEYFEKQAVIPIEGVIGTVEGISEIESTIQMTRGSRATIYAYFKYDVNIDYTFIKLQERLNEISYSIPEEFNVAFQRWILTGFRTCS